MRIISDETYAQLVQVLLEDNKVALFQKLVLSEKTEDKTIESTAEEEQES